MTRNIGFLVFPDFQILDLSGPLAAFEIAGRSESGNYRLHVVSQDGGPVQSTAGLDVLTHPMSDSAFDTLIVAGGSGSREAAAAENFLTLLRAAAAQSRRTASVCSGALILAAAGLLDGGRATTHWRVAPTMRRQYPAIQIEEDKIFVRFGQIWTSAGIAAGIDLALALIEDDLGAEASKAVARELVVYHRRSGGQSQFSTMLELDPQSDRIRRAISFARDHLHENLPVERLADAACLSSRQFGRAFHAETGETPARAIERLRVDAARARLESGNEPLETVANAVGFSDAERMRRAFIRLYGLPPQAIRRTSNRQLSKPVRTD